MQRGGVSIATATARLRGRRSRARSRLLRRLALADLAAAGLSACASISEKIAGTMSEAPAIGLPADAPERPVDAAGLSGGPRHAAAAHRRPC